MKTFVMGNANILYGSKTWPCLVCMQVLLELFRESPFRSSFKVEIRFWIDLPGNLTAGAAPCDFTSQVRFLRP